MENVIVKNMKKAIYNLRYKGHIMKIKGINHHTDINIIKFYASNNKVSKYIYLYNMYIK